MPDHPMMTPDPVVCAAMDEQVNARLIAAIDYVMRDVLDQGGAPPGMVATPMLHALQALIREAAVSGDTNRIAALLRANGPALRGQGVPTRCHVVPWGAPDLPATDFALLQSAFQDDIGLTARLAPPTPAHLDRARANFAVLRACLPVHLAPWWQELEALVALILLAEGDDKTARFGGATAFAAWGAILINPANSATPLALALTLVHESSHLKLFHAYLEDEIVLNDPEARFTSPLRREGRPMNGIYHATYVLARMLAFLSDLDGSKPALAALGPGAAEQVRADLDHLRAGFDAGRDVIRAHGVLTAKGQRIMDEASSTVERCFAANAAE
ncbi:aKG-HExxH-type peptide beta-hydroxylase [Tropicibacter oceani]|uniref:HEXXH motif-containing putative peptide modification protein n=1 Tax=Tropicibacter oceani TaxID=3058420 RepID=A0ABY8QIL9_9RHOB|nr:HEXXH motif-containing putative peptide modification protein [Tropicibacter oceani]WGW03642.1 HEXXH motif-containing putative peptide modification protein [Tropicibacter oceani]